MCTPLSTWDILWVFKVFALLIEGLDIQLCSLLCFSLAVEKMTSPVATLWLCFQDIQKRFSIPRNCFKSFILKNEQREGVRLRSYGSVPAAKATASSPLCWGAAALSKTVVIPLQICFVCSRGKAPCWRIKATRWACWSKVRKDSFHPSQC